MRLGHLRQKPNCVYYFRPANSSQVKVQVIKSDTTMTSNVNLWIERQKVVGNATVENLDFKLVESVLKDVV